MSIRFIAHKSPDYTVKRLVLTQAQKLFEMFAATVRAAAVAVAVAVNTIHVKLLSGDIIPVGIPVGASGHDVYARVFDVLPLDIRPSSDYCMALFSFGEDEDEDEDEKNEKEPLLHSLKPFTKKDGDTFCLIIEPTKYAVYLDYICEAFETVDSVHYDRFRMLVIRDDSDTFYSTSFYSKQGCKGIFFREKDIRVQNSTQFQEGDLIQIPEDVLPITHQDLFAPLQGRVSQEIMEELQQEFLAEMQYQLATKQGWRDGQDEPYENGGEDW